MECPSCSNNEAFFKQNGTESAHLCGVCGASVVDGDLCIKDGVNTESSPDENCGLKRRLENNCYNCTREGCVDHYYSVLQWLMIFSL
jgi:hypothetical protein